MNHPMILSYIITFLGLSLCGFSTVFIYLGRKISGDSGEPQILKYKGVEVRTNAVITLLLVSVVVAVLPLGLLYFKPLPAGEKTEDPPKKAARTLWIIGRVEDESGAVVREAMVKLSHVEPSSGPDVKSEVRIIGGDGQFDFPAVAIDEEQGIRLTTEKEGYKSQTLILGVGQVNYPLVLARDSGRR